MNEPEIRRAEILADSAAAETVYACTYIEKRAEVDSYEHGCNPDTAACVMSESARITGKSLKELLLKIGEWYGLNIDDVFLPGIDDESITYIGYNRMENAEGDAASHSELDGWKRGEFDLWLADYHFAIEKRLVMPLTRSQFDAEGIKVH